MIRHRATLCAAVVCSAASLVTLSSRAGRAQTGLPSPMVPRGFGVNIHFTDPQPGEMARFAEAGFGFARMDLFWHQIEKEKGKYDFSAYDRLLGHLKQAGARPLFILDYGNDLYQEGSPRSPEARAAFAKFAAVAAAHYRDQGVLFEIWNEPNIGFWRPKPDVNEYAALALDAAKAVRSADPNAIILAPGSSGFPWDYLDTVLKSGLLHYIDAVSVHPYRGQEPESAAADFARLRALISRYAPPEKRQMPMISSEWGYSTREGGGVSEAAQARYLTRMWLANLASGVNLSIFYDWKNDGTDPKENEHNFGTVRQDLTPKPSFLAAKQLIRDLDGYAFRHRLLGKSDADWRLLFQKGDGPDLALVTWSADSNATAADQAPSVRRVEPSAPEYSDLIRLASVRFPYGPLGEGGGRSALLPVSVAAEPVHANNGVQVRLERPVKGPAESEAKFRVVVGVGTINMTLPLPPQRNDAAPAHVRILWDGKPVKTEVAPLVVKRTDPLSLVAAPATEEMRITVENPATVPFEGTVAVTSGKKTLSERPIKLAKGDERTSVFVPLPSAKEKVAIRLREGKAEAASLPERRYVPISGFDGKHDDVAPFSQILFVENVAQKPTPLTMAATPDNSPATVGLKFLYHFDKGWRYAQAAPASAAAGRIPAGAKAAILWIYSDGPGDYLRSRFKDSTGQTFQVDLSQLTGRGWRPMTIPLDGTGVGVSWGGANDQRPHGPLSWEGLILVDSANTAAEHDGIVLVAAPSYVVED